MRMNAAGLAILKRFETCRLKAYPDVVGFSIGWGHHAPDIGALTAWTQEQADLALLSDIAEAERELASLLTTAVSDNAWSALVDLVYNAGAGELKGSHTIEMVNAGRFAAAADRLLLWDIVAGQPSVALRARRAAERNLFLTPDTET